MRVYTDTSMLVALLREEEHSRWVRQWLRTSSDRVVIGNLAILEFSSAVSRMVRTRESNGQQAISRLDAFDEFSSQCEVCHHTVQDFALADRLIRDFQTKLAAPDALHIATSMRLNAALATLDRRMAEAASGKGVDVVAPGR